MGITSFGGEFMATATKARKFEVGQRVWSFSENTRVYERSPDGLSGGGPIYEKHFSPLTVVGIEGRSYLIGVGHPVAENAARFTEKVGFGRAEKCYYTDEGKRDKVWVNHHRHRVAALLGRAPAEKIRQVARVLGYDGGPD